MQLVIICHLNDLQLQTQWHLIRLPKHRHSQTGRQLTQGHEQNEGLICRGFIHGLTGPAPFAPKHISIFDLCWANIHTCSHTPLSACLAAAPYSYWSVHLLASVPQRSLRLNVPCNSCCVDSGERQRKMTWMKLKLNWYLKWMLQAACRPFSARVHFICISESRLRNCGVIQP